jgi:hypothetical protein
MLNVVSLHLNEIRHISLHEEYFSAGTSNRLQFHRAFAEAYDYRKSGG